MKKKDRIQQQTIKEPELPTTELEKPTATAFFDAMNLIEEFQGEFTEELCYEDYETLSETAIVLRTLGNVLTFKGQNDYFASRLREAEAELSHYRKLVSGRT